MAIFELRWGLVFQVEVTSSGLLFGAGFGQRVRNQSEQGGFVGKEAGDAGAAFDLLVHALNGVEGAHESVMGELKGMEQICEERMVARGYVITKEVTTSTR